MSEDDVTASGSTQAEVRLPSRDLHADLSFYGGTLGFRLESIFPADDPAVAVMTGHGLRIRLDRGADDAPGTIRLLCDRPETFAAGQAEIEAPNGTRIEICAREPEFVRPPTRHELVVRRMGEGESWVVGRAGMQYRDLIPGRLGGAVVASHIRIPDGGPVPDMVHYHTITFQLIYCCRGWFDLVYEDQGPPFRLGSGGLRHPAPADSPPSARVVGQRRGDRAGRARRAPDHHRPRARPAHRRARSSA